ncbi:helix-turn-helix domain-containing protein [Roseovarius aestuariivivens]|uniref:helix-turn-helix domain-containing protein n=1 Tax=Roseovarius aestuariivivens TaxID=1888910 RepID=UPI00143681A7|nr:helix-turn-helix domain-containing protein [Roseovarius aestuariivivens]
MRGAFDQVKKKSSYHKLLKINDAVCDKQLKAYDKLVFERLVWRVNPETGACFPSVGLIAEELSITERAVRKCVARLEEHGYVKRCIHAGRTKANDYLIPGLNTERLFLETGTQVPKNRNEGSAQIIKERKKEKEASEEKVPVQNLSPSSERGVSESTLEGQFHNQLVDALGGGQDAWSEVLDVSDDVLADLER